MVRPIVRYGEAGLTVPARRVDTIDDRVTTLLKDMVETMHAAPGVGLAAPQIGVPLRVAVIDLSVGRRAGELVTLINPESVEQHGMQIEDEGCLSVPGFTCSVARAARVVVRALDEHGRAVTIEGAGLLARALQHELDHLDGVLFLNRLRRVRRALIERKIARLRHQGRW